MKIAIDCRLIGESGIGTFIENVVSHMVEISNISFVLIGKRQYLDKYTNLGNCKIVECSYQSFSLQELFLFPIKDVNNCDAFYTPNFNIPMGIRVPIYATIHDIVFFDTENFSSSIHTIALRWYIKRALKITKGLFTVSEFSRQRIQDYFHYNKEIKVVCNGLSMDIQNYISSHPVHKNRSGIIYIGNIKKYKGLDILWKAYQRLIKDGSNIPQLTIIGRFNFRTKDTEMLQILESNKDNIRLISDADNEQLYKLLSEAQCLVSPSLYEGFGIPPLEAMALGTPVIMSDIPVYKEIYKNFPVIFFKAGNAIDLHEKLKNLPSAPINVSDLIASKYTYQRAAKEIIQLINADKYQCNR